MKNMKKTLALLLAVVLVLGMFPMGAMAEETTEELVVEQEEELLVEEPAVVEEPVVEEPVVEEPVVEEPVVEEPVAEEPVVEEPVVEEPVVEEPVVEEPVAEEPVVEETVAEETPAEEETEQTETDAEVVEEPAYVPAGKQPVVSFTNAAPVPKPQPRTRFMMRSAVPAGKEAEGVETFKNVTANDDGTYTVTLENWTTGSVKTETQGGLPADIILVFDVSMSMSEQLGTSGETKLKAMQDSAIQFVNEVAQNAEETGLDHRVAVFAVGEQQNKPQCMAGTWKPVTEKCSHGMLCAVCAINGDYNDLDTYHKQNVDANRDNTYLHLGLSDAVSALDSGTYQKDYASRNRIVVVFSDGVPTTGDDENVLQNTSMSIESRVNTVNTNRNQSADSALLSAYKIKNGIMGAGGADPNKQTTIYAVSLYQGANGKQDYVKDGLTADNTWILLEDGTLNRENEGNMNNKFMHLLSSNYWLDGSAYSSSTSPFTHMLNHPGNKNTNWTVGQNGYYLSASSTADLENIFTTIQNEILVPAIDLDEETVVQDVVTEYFDIVVPEGAENAAVSVYTSDKQADGDWAEREAAEGIEVTVDPETRVVTAKGFDYSENAVTEQGMNGFYGKKLIVEFTIKPREGFLGGNQVPTNVLADSGIYDGGELIENYTYQAKDVPIPDFTITAKVKNVYLLADLTADQLWTDAAAVTEDGVDLLAADLGWRDDYVEVQKNVEGKTDLTEDTTYQLSLAIEPLHEGSVVKTEKSNTAEINVFKPEITWEDSQINLGETAVYKSETYSDTDNFVSLVWKHGEKVAVSGEMTGDEPTLTYEYTPGAAAFKADTPVDVTIKISTVDVTNHVTFHHEDCSFPGCGWAEAEKAGYEFIVHIKTFDLTIVKTGAEAIDPGVTFLFNVTCPDQSVFQVMIAGNGSRTITGLPVGKYTVTEDESWSWRYTADSASMTITANNVEDGVVTVTFNNKRDTDKWLDGYTFAENLFAKLSAAE